MITYTQVKKAMLNPPTEDLVHLFNILDHDISHHSLCINDDNPYDRLIEKNSFCISATSIQSKYIAFVLSKQVGSEFPPEVMKDLFDTDPAYTLQYSTIKGNKIDGCICLIHKEDKNFDIREVYQNIYS